MGATTTTTPSKGALRGLDALNFFLADVRDGLGPYLAIYLIAVRGPDHGWNEATTGLVMTSPASSASSPRPRPAR